MSRLLVFADDGRELSRTSDGGGIARTLAGVGIRFERWPTREGEPMTAYAAEIAQLKSLGGFVTVDLARLGPNADPEKAAAARAKFLDEHTHSDDEVRFFIEGKGAFYLRLDGKIHIVVCEAGDLLSVPAGTKHWFDMGTKPHFAALRFFRTPDGWVGAFTGDPIAKTFPTFDQLTS